MNKRKNKIKEDTIQVHISFRQSLYEELKRRADLLDIPLATFLREIIVKGFKARDEMH